MTDHAAAPRHAWPIAVLVLILAVHALVNAWWLMTDNLPRMGDDAQHAVFAKGMHDIATNADWSVQGRVRALAQASTGIYPPLFHYAALLSGLVFGPTRAGFAAINTPVLWALAFAVYALAAHCLRPRYALLAAATCSVLPMIAGTSRLCITDLLTALWVTLALLALLRAGGFQARVPSVLFGVFVGLGLLTRWMAPLYLVVPVLVAVSAGWRQVRAPSLPPDAQRAATRRWLVTLGLAAAAALVLAAPWYAPRVPQLLGVYADHFRPLDGPSPFHAGGMATPPGSTGASPPPTPAVRYPVLEDFGPFEARTWLSYGLLLNNKGLFLPTSLAALAGLLLALFSPRRQGIGYLLAAILGSYALLTLFWAVRAPAPRYLIPMLPALAVFPALALQAIPSIRWRTGAVTAFCAWLLFQFVHFSIAPVSGLPRADLPWFKDHPLVRFTDDHGVVLWASHVNASGARIGPPYTGLNWIDHAYETIGQHEVTVFPGNSHQANIMLAGALKPSLESVQHLHWPRVNPLDPHAPRVRAMINPFVPLATWQVSGRRLDAAWSEPVWLDALSVDGASDAVAFEYHGGTGDWQPLADIACHEGFGFRSFPRARVRMLRTVEAIPGDAALTAFRHVPQPRPFVLIEHADHPRDWPAERLEAADYLVVVSTEAGGFYDGAPAAFDILEQFEAPLHGYWDERRVTIHARRHARPLALDTAPGMRIEAVEAGETLAGRWDMPFWRMGRFQAPGIDGRPDAWESEGRAVVEISFPEPIAIGRMDTETTGTSARWAYRGEDGWMPLATGVLPPGPVDALQLTLSPLRPATAISLRQVFLEPAAVPAP